MLSDFGQTYFELAHKLLGPFACIDQCANRPDHIEDPGDTSLVEGMDGEPAADQIGGDTGLKVREGQDEIGL